MRPARGFTLIELITVIVVLAIVAALGSGFVVSAVESYRDTQQRAKLVQKGRLAIEQMTRQLRMALPHSLRTNTSGNCIEFMPIVGGASYLAPVPSVQNGADFTVPPEIDTVAFTIGEGNIGQHVVIGGLSADEIYTTNNPAARADLAANMIDGIYTKVTLADSSHHFLRNSISQRLFITSDPIRFCAHDDNLKEYSDYGVITGPVDDNPHGTEVIIVTNVEPANGEKAFVLSTGSEDRNTAIHINLEFQQGGSAVEFHHQVLVRNVP